MQWPQVSPLEAINGDLIGPIADRLKVCIHYISCQHSCDATKWSKEVTAAPGKVADLDCA